MSAPNGEPLLPVPDPVVIEKGSVNPMKVAMSIAVLMASVGILVSGTSPINLEDTLSPLAQYVFSTMGIVSAVVTLAGIFWSDRRDGLLIEIPGLIGLGGILVTYGVSIYSITPGEAFLSSVAAPLTIGLGFACVFRVWQIWREIRRTARDVARTTRARKVSDLLDEQEEGAEK